MLIVIVVVAMGRAVVPREMIVLTLPISVPVVVAAVGAAVVGGIAATGAIIASPVIVTVAAK